MAGIQVFARLPEGKLIEITLPPEGTVNDLMEEVRQAAGLRTAPGLRFLGKLLEPLMPVADTGITTEAVVEVVPRASVRISIAAGGAHSLALGNKGYHKGSKAKLHAWGHNSYGQTDIPDFEGLQAVQVAAGAYHSMALLEDHTVR
eukprot:Hpha_TRINITY_DN16663_c1_g1::TRINITY_DN16663_c1_g1_i3::g.181636::m.181636